MEAYLHCFGRHLETNGWDRIMTEPGGQIPTFVDAFRDLEQFVKAVGCGTGASKAGGKYEAQVIFEEIEQQVKATTLSSKKKVKALSLPSKPNVDCRSYDTEQELKNALEFMTGAGCNTFVGVTCPSHLPRCCNTADLVFANSAIKQIWIASKNRYVGDSPGGCVVFEQPHLPNDQFTNLPLNKLMKLFWSKWDKESCAKAIANVMARFS